MSEKEANRYIIYQAILKLLPKSKNLDDLKSKLVKQNIETLYKYKGQTRELQGISFKIGDYKYKGSEIDRKFSVKNLEKEIYRQTLRAESENYRKFLWNSYSNDKGTFTDTGKELKKERSLVSLKKIMNLLPMIFFFQKGIKRKNQEDCICKNESPNLSLLINPN